MTTRKRYSKEFKLDAISLVNDQGYNKAKAARNLGVSPGLERRRKMTVQLSEVMGDNAVAERFFGNLKQERAHWYKDVTRYDAQQHILNYITMWYNGARLHSYLEYCSPNDFEMMNGYLEKVS